MTEIQKDDIQERLIDVTDKIKFLIEEKVETCSVFLLKDLNKAVVRFPSRPKSDIELVLTFKLLALEDACGLAGIFQMENVIFFGSPSGSYSGVVEMSGYISSEVVEEFGLGKSK